MTVQWNAINSCHLKVLVTCDSCILFIAKELYSYVILIILIVLSFIRTFKSLIFEAKFSLKGISFHSFLYIYYH